MTMDLKKAVTEVVKNNQVTKKSYNVGDIVYFKGGTHYVSSYSEPKVIRQRQGKLEFISVQTAKAMERLIPGV